MKLNKKNATYLPEKEKIERKWLVIDAADQVLGRLATRVADILRGKDRPEYTPFFDCGDFVVIINARKIKVTGHKDEQKMYYRHSGYMGNLKEIPFQRMLQNHPDRIFIEAVKGMLPKNKLSRQLLTKLRVYPDAQHQHAAQKPEVVKL
jgi:large subunit ribosomal protein L13